jgi:cysteine desulfurase
MPGIVGFGAALACATDWERVRGLRDRLEAEVLGIRPDACILGAGAPRLPNTSCILTPGLAAEVQLMALDLAGIAVSSGAACSSGKVGPSHVLATMGVPPDLARCAIRVSLGWASGEPDVAGFVAAWRRLAARQPSLHGRDEAGHPLPLGGSRDATPATRGAP